MTISKENKRVFLLILIAYVFSIAVRLIWVYQFHGYEPFIYNNQFMINTNDGYFWAEGARDLLAGFHQSGDLSPMDQAASQLTYVFAKLLPFSFETIIFYMPAFLGSLLVIPIILIGYSYKRLDVGFIAALLASIAWSYYNRTMVGYYDTDMLNVVMPIFLLWSIIWAINTNEEKYLVITAIDIIIYRWWYPQSYSLESAFFAFILVHALFFDRKNIFNFKLLAIMLFAMMMTDGFIRLPIVVTLYLLFKNEKFDKYVYYILAAGAVAYMISGGFDSIWLRLKLYIFRDSVNSAPGSLGLHFFTVMQTVREAGQVPFSEFASRISGSPISFILAVGGYAWLSYKHRIMLFALPLVGLGFMAVVGGLRFTIYAVVPMAFGLAFLIAQTAKKIPSYFIKYSVLAIGTFLVLLPNVLHIQEYSVPTVFSKDEVTILSAFKNKASRDDYVVSWWDYGYPIRYYSDVFTLVDGAKHDGDVNFPVSYILTKPQDAAAKMARLDVEYDVRALKISQQNAKKEVKQSIASNIEEMTKANGFQDTNDFLEALQSGKAIQIPKKSRDVYIYLPLKMMDIYPTVTLFSNLDLMSGMRYADPIFISTQVNNEDDHYIYLHNGATINKSSATIKLGDKELPINRFVKTGYKQDGKLDVDQKQFSSMSDINVIYMESYGKFLIVDEATYNSLYVQLFVLENYDKNLFEAVQLTPYAKIFKLKI